MLDVVLVSVQRDESLKEKGMVVLDLEVGHGVFEEIKSVATGVLTMGTMKMVCLQLSSSASYALAVA